MILFSQIPTGILSSALSPCVKELANGVCCNRGAHHHPNNAELIKLVFYA